MITLSSFRQDYIQIHIETGEKCFALYILSLPPIYRECSLPNNWSINNTVLLSSTNPCLTGGIPISSDIRFWLSYHLWLTSQALEPVSKFLRIPLIIVLFYYIKPRIQHVLIIKIVHSKFHSQILNTSYMLGPLFKLGTQKGVRTHSMLSLGCFSSLKCLGFSCETLCCIPVKKSFNMKTKVSA